MPKNPYRHLPISFFYLFLFGFLIAMITTFQEYLNYLMANFEYPFSWFSVSLRNTSNLLFLSILTPLIAYSARILSTRHSLTFGLLFWHILLSVFVAATHRFLSTLTQSLVYSWVTHQQGVALFSNWLIRTSLAGLVSSLIYYWLLSGIFIAAINQKKLIEKEKELANARLSALMAQLKPHFLFNTLNSIAALIDLDTKSAQKMIARFGELLRGVLDRGEQQFIPLRQEIEFIENYLSIEQERYKAQLTVLYDLDDYTLEAEVPTLILQPIVENAIKHGIAKMISGGKIQIRSSLHRAQGSEEPILDIEVLDNGPGIQAPIREGVGLENVKNRLNTLYLDSSRLLIENIEPQGCLVRLTIPLKLYRYENTRPDY